MLYLKSVCVGLLLASVGSLMFLLRMLVVGSRFSRDVGIDARIFRTPQFLSLAIVLFLVGFLSAFWRLRARS